MPTWKLILTTIMDKKWDVKKQTKIRACENHLKILRERKNWFSKETNKKFGMEKQGRKRKPQQTFFQTFFASFRCYNSVLHCILINKHRTSQISNCFCMAKCQALFLRPRENCSHGSKINNLLYSFDFCIVDEATSIQQRF